MPFDATDYVPATVDPRTLETPRERLIYLRDFLRDLPPERFDTRNFIGRHGQDVKGKTPIAAIKECGTAACVAGWACVLFAPHSRRPGYEYDGLAATKLGLTEEQIDPLFRPEDWLEPGRYTPAQAAAVLTHLIETGEIDWSVA